MYIINNTCICMQQEPMQKSNKASYLHDPNDDQYKCLITKKHKHRICIINIFMADYSTILKFMSCCTITRARAHRRISVNV